MLALTLLVASIALADSINPSTLIPALWLASTKASRVGAYTLGVFTVYLLGGLLLLLGPGPAVIRFFHHLHGPLEHGIEAVGGALAIVFALVVWRSRHRTDDQRRVRPCPTRASAFALGAGIMVIELPTAFMYFGAISAVLAAHTALPGAIALVTTYNVLFVAPLAALIAATHLAGDRTDRWIAAASGRLHAFGVIAVTAVAGLGGATLVALGVGGLLVV